MTQKYIIHENCDLYTSHGSIQAFSIYDSFKRGLLGLDFKVAGFKPHGEEISNILDMKEIDATNTADEIIAKIEDNYNKYMADLTNKEEERKIKEKELGIKEKELKERAKTRPK